MMSKMALGRQIPNRMATTPNTQVTTRESLRISSSEAFRFIRF